MRIVIAALYLISFITSNYSEDSYSSITISVIDTRTGVPVKTGSVYLGNSGKSHLVDENGECRFDSILPGKLSITVSAPEYDTFVETAVQIDTGNNPVFIAKLVKRIEYKELDNMVVVGNTTIQKTPSQTTSVTRLSKFELSNTAGTVNDINRVLSTHPAVVSSIGEDFDNSLYVRGGHSSENVYIIDGIEMENANHFSSVDRSGGKVGFINSSLVQDLEFYTGAFPASMPSRLSSVIDVRLKTASKEKTAFQTDLNVTGLGFLFEVPLTKYASVLANIRFADFRVLEPLLNTGGVPKYGDGFFKTVFTPNEFNLFRVTTVGAIDSYIEECDTLDFRVPSTNEERTYQAGVIGAWEFNNEVLKNEVSISGALRKMKRADNVYKFRDTVILKTLLVNESHFCREHLLIDSLYEPTDTMFRYEESYVRKVIDGSEDNRWHGFVNDKFTLYLRGNDRLNLGMSVGNHSYSVKKESGILSKSTVYYYRDGAPVIIPRYTNVSLPYDIDSSIDVRQYSGYAEYVISEGLFKAVAGIRGDYFSVITDYGVSPRLGLRMDVSKAGTFSMSGGLYYQFPAEFNGLIEHLLLVNPNNDYQNGIPVNRAKLQRCWEAAVGYEKLFAGGQLLIIESYLKWYDREYPFVRPGERQFVTTRDNLHYRLDKPTGKKKAYGIEFSFQKKKYEHFYYALSGALLDVKNRYTDKKWYNDENNVRATLGLSMGWNSRHHGISIRASGSGGRPYSPVFYDEKWSIYNFVKGKYYSESLDPVFTINLRYSFKIYPRRGSITGYVELWNLLNTTPVVERYLDNNGLNDYETNGIIPVGGVTVDF